MAIPRSHRHGLMTGSLLNFLDAGPRHCQPRAERVPVAMPDVAADARIFQAGMKPGSRIEAFASLTWKDGIGAVLLWASKRLDSLNRIRVEMDSAHGAVLRFA
jgi:hypothetical protein